MIVPMPLSYPCSALIVIDKLPGYPERQQY